MFIFSSNSAKYVFEYRPSKPYRVTYSEKLLISPSIMRSGLERASGETLFVDYTIGGISAELRDLLLSYTVPEEDIGKVNYVLGGISVELRDILINYVGPDADTGLVDYTIGGVSAELKDVLITHTTEVDKVDYVFGNISGVIENV